MRSATFIARSRISLGFLTGLFTLGFGLMATPSNHAHAQSDPHFAAKDAALTVEDVQAQIDARAKDIRTRRPEFSAYIDALLPVRARSGALRFTDPKIEEADAAFLLAQRFSSAANPELRRAIADALPRTGADFVAIAWAQLQVEVSALVKTTLAHSLWRARGPLVAPSFKLALLDLDPEVRRNAVIAAEHHPDRQRFAFVIEAGLQDASEAVQLAAIRASGTLQSSEALPQLESFLTNAQPMLRLYALRAADRIDPGVAATWSQRYGLSQDQDARVARLAVRIAQR